MAKIDPVHVDDFRGRVRPGAALAAGSDIQAEPVRSRRIDSYAVNGLDVRPARSYLGTDSDG